MKERSSGQFTKSLAKSLRPVFEFSQLVWVTITVAKMILVVQRYRHGVRAHIHTEDERLAAAAKEDFVSFSLRKKEQRCQWCLSYCYSPCTVSTLWFNSWDSEGFSKMQFSLLADKLIYPYLHIYIFLLFRMSTKTCFQPIKIIIKTYDIVMHT